MVDGTNHSPSSPSPCFSPIIYFPCLKGETTQQKSDREQRSNKIKIDKFIIKKKWKNLYKNIYALCFICFAWMGFLDFYETCEYNCGCGVSYFFCVYFEKININKYK